MNTDSSPLDAFFVRVEQAFNFLEEKYGFIKQPSIAKAYANPFHVRYENKTTAVMIEGVSWGSAAVVSIGRKDGSPKVTFDFVPLWTLASLEGAGHETALNVPGQSAQIEASAEALVRLAGPALHGDFSHIDAARTYLRKRMSEMSKT